VTSSVAAVALFDGLAANYEEHFAAPHRRAYDALAWEVVAGHLPERPGVVVDAGCGIGRWVEKFLALDHRVVGIENSPAMAATARNRIRDPRFRLIEDSMDSVELPARVADLVVAMGSVQYSADPEATVEHLASSLRRGGTLCVLVDSLAALVLELMRRGEHAEALTRAATRRGIWYQHGRFAEHHLLDRARLEAAFASSGLVEVTSFGLLVGASLLGRERLISRLENGWEAQLAFERRLTRHPVIADLGKQLLVCGRKP
jgi:SAM-dependent methyltransferase